MMRKAWSLEPICLVHIPAVLLISLVTQGKLFDFSVSQFFCLVGLFYKDLATWLEHYVTHFMHDIKEFVKIIWEVLLIYRSDAVLMKKYMNKYLKDEQYLYNGGKGRYARQR